MLDVSARGIARIVLVGGLTLALVIGLLWAFNPDDEGGISFSGDRGGSPADDGATEEPTEPEQPEATIDPEATAEPTPEPTETGLSPEEAEELIEAAPPPEETTVQVLDAGGGRAAMESAAEALAELGYVVVNTTSSRTDVTTTTVWFTDGSEDAALALRARDERFAEVGENERLSEGVDLHVLVGPDWEG